MICCLCGEQLRPGDLIYVGTLYRFRVDPYTGETSLSPTIMEDGSESKLAHFCCMVDKGYPLEVVGAGRLPDA